MDGDVVDYEVVFHGVSRCRTTCRWAKKVVYEANNHKVVALCYELDCEVDALLDHETTLALGVKVENIPLQQKTKIPRKMDFPNQFQGVFGQLEIFIGTLYKAFFSKQLYVQCLFILTAFC